MLSKCLYVRLQQTQFCWALWNWGQAWVPRSDFVDSTRGHEVPDAGENQILGASDMNRVGVFEPYSSGNSSVTYIINCHACVPGTCMVLDGNLHFFLSLIPRVRPGGTPCVTCLLTSKRRMKSVLIGQGHDTLISMKMLYWAPHLSQNLDLGVRFFSGGLHFILASYTLCRPPWLSHLSKSVSSFLF